MRLAVWFPGMPEWERIQADVALEHRPSMKRNSSVRERHAQNLLESTEYCVKLSSPDRSEAWKAQTRTIMCTNKFRGFLVILKLYSEALMQCMLLDL